MQNCIQASEQNGREWDIQFSIEWWKLRVFRIFYKCLFHGIYISILNPTNWSVRRSVESPITIWNYGKMPRSDCRQSTFVANALPIDRTPHWHHNIYIRSYMLIESCMYCTSLHSPKTGMERLSFRTNKKYWPRGASYVPYKTRSCGGGRTTSTTSE